MSPGLLCNSLRLMESQILFRIFDPQVRRSWLSCWTWWNFMKLQRWVMQLIMNIIMSVLEAVYGKKWKCQRKCWIKFEYSYWHWKMNEDSLQMDTAKMSIWPSFMKYRKRKRFSKFNVTEIKRIDSNLLISF